MVKDDHRQTIADSNQELRGERPDEDDVKTRREKTPDSSDPITEENSELDGD